MADSPMVDAQARKTAGANTTRSWAGVLAPICITTMCSGCYVEQRVTRPTSIRPEHKRCTTGNIRIVAKVTMMQLFGVFGTRQTMQPLT
jgi:hypothetical protein